MDSNFKQLIYLAIKNKEVDIAGTCRFTEESTYVYPKDVEYKIKDIYVWDNLHHQFDLHVCREDEREPMCSTLPNKYTTVYDHHLIISDDFRATIKGTDIVLTFDEIKQYMIENSPEKVFD